MPPVLTLLSNGATIQETDLTSRLDLIAAWMNYGITASDFVTSPSARFVKSRHIFGPEFYGAPAPRVEMVSSDTHYRRVGVEPSDRSIHHQDHQHGAAGDNLGWVTIRDLEATIKVIRDSTEIDFFTSFYAYEIGLSTVTTPNNALAMECALFQNGTELTGTRRQVGASGTSTTGGPVSPRYTRLMVSFCGSFQLNRGEYDIEARCRVIYDGAAPRQRKHHFISARQMVVEVHHR